TKRADDADRALKAERDKNACLAASLTLHAKELQDQLAAAVTAQQAFQRLQAELKALQQKGGRKGRVGDSLADGLYCCVAGCRVSPRGRFFHHGSGPSQLHCCQKCYDGLKGGKVPVLAGRPIVKADLELHVGEKGAEPTIPWLGALLSRIGLSNPDNYCSINSLVQVLRRFGFFEE
ncbi:unnamed protein product, partial [Laminaria digitata]